MGSPLNRIPRGLLEYFGIKSGEWGPRELGQVLQPVLELRDWYANADAVEIVAEFAGAGVFVADVAIGNIPITGTFPADFVGLISGGALLVPQDETWLILEAGCSLDFSPVAGQFGDVHWRSRGLALPMIPTGFQTSDAALARRLSNQLVRPFWSRPGDSLAVSSNGIEVGAVNVALQARVRFVRFRI